MGCVGADGGCETPGKFCSEGLELVCYHLDLAQWFPDTGRVSVR